MKIGDVLAASTSMIKGLKEMETANGPADIRPIIEVFRGDEPIALVTMRHHYRDEILRAAGISANGFDADSLAMSIETYYGVGSAFTSPDINPLTRKRWEQNEMGDVAKNHDGIAKGWVKEALMITVVNRAGDMVAVHQPYSYAGNKLVWDKQEQHMSTLTGDRVEGTVPETLLNVMKQPSASTWMAKRGHLHLSRTDRDLLTTKFLQQDFDLAVMLFTDPDDSARLEALRAVGEIMSPDD